MSTGCRQNPNLNSDTYAKWVAWGTFLLAIATFGLWYETEKEGSFSKKARIEDERAFVYPVNVNFFWYPDTKGFRFNFVPYWKNSGRTPTRHLEVYADAALEDSHSFKGCPSNRMGDPSQVKGYLGPQQILYGAPAPATILFTEKDMLDVQNKNKILYFWGWAKYNDIFDNKGRETKFCWTINPLGDFRPFRPSGNHQVTFFQYREGNCSDEDCEKIGNK